MYRSYFEQLEEIIGRNLKQRGMDKIPLKGELERAAVSLYGGTAIFIVTGFAIRDTLSGETDGPLGAVSLAAALEQLGKEIVLITDEYTKDILGQCSKATGVRAPVETIYHGSEEEFTERLLNRYKPSHVVAIERPGRSSDGRCYSMRGEDISDLVPNTDILFEESRKSGITTIAVGDGGNEIGMGKICRYVKNSVFRGEQICAAFASDFLIIAGVSNWGGHALAGALSIIDRRMLLHDLKTELHILRSMVEAGAVDGCTKARTTTVDGLSLQENISIFLAIRRIIERTLDGYRPLTVVQ